MPTVAAAPDYLRELRLHALGFVRVAGVDEAGRGPLAGPVVAAAVVFPNETSARAIPGLTDSKRLPERLRERLFDAIREAASAWSVSRIEADEIDRINILEASLKAMALAVGALDPPPDAVLTDGNQSPARHFPAGFRPRVETVVKGDALSLSIAAASVLAKVTRDRLMAEYDALYPEYGFARHKGYPSPEHRAAVERFGACPIHRQTFRGVSSRRP